MGRRLMEVNENTGVTIPIRNLIAIGVGLSLFVGQFFLLEGRITSLEEHSRGHAEELEYAKNFRYQWSRGELGLIGVDIEQNIRLDHIEQDIIHEHGRRPYDDAWQSDSAAFEPLGAKWLSMDDDAAWGGEWGDGNHFSFTHNGVR